MSVYDDLFEKGVAEIQLICNKCISQHDVVIAMDEVIVLDGLPNIGIRKPSPIKKLRCNMCMITWYICTSCSSCRKPYFTGKSCYNHLFSLHHENLIRYKKAKTVKKWGKKKMPMDVATYYDYDNNSDRNESGDDYDYQDNSSDFNYPIILTHKDEYERKYHEMNLKGLANQFLVVQSSHSSLADEDTIKKFPMDQTRLQLEIALFVNNLTRGERQKFVSIISRVEDYTIQKYKNINYKDSMKWSIIPNNITDLNRMYISGKSSIYDNLPSPKAIRLDDYHGYMSLRDSIISLLSFDVDFELMLTNNYKSKGMCDKFNNRNIEELFFDYPSAIEDDETITSFYESPFVMFHMNKVIEKVPNENVLVLFIFEFADDHNPYSQVLSGLPGQWDKVVNISPNRHSMHTMSCMVPISYGYSGEDHESVESKYRTELLSLSDLNSPDNVAYVHRLKKNIRIHTVLAVALNDQIELRSSNALCQGNSTYHVQKGVSCNYKEVANVIPSCRDCYRRLFSREYEQINLCDKCISWDVSHVIKTASTKCNLLATNPKKNYPAELMKEGKIQPFLIDYPKIIKAITVATENYQSDKWSVSNVTDYLLTFGINLKHIKKIMEREKNIKAYEFSKHRQNQNERHRKLKKLKDSCPELFDSLSAKSLWERGACLNQHINVIMHMLFLGVCRYVVKQTISIINKCKDNHVLINTLTRQLSMVGSLKISWLNCSPLKANGNTTGWVSKNYVSVARICKWWFSGIMHSVLRSQRTTNEPIYVHIFQKRSYTPSDLIMNTYITYNNMVGQIFNNTITRQSIAELSRVIKIFLNEYNLFDSVMFNGKVITKTNINSNDIQNLADEVIEKYTDDFEMENPDPSNTESTEHNVTEHVAFGTSGNRYHNWVAACNFLCLLNIPEQIAMFGPAMDQYEGAGLGEKTIQISKHYFSSYRKNWDVVMLQNVVNDIIFKRIMKNNDGSPDANTMKKKATRKHEYEVDGDDEEYMYKNYASTADIIMAKQNNLPISGLLHNSEFYVCVNKKLFYKAKPIQYHCYFSGQHYHTWNVNLDKHILGVADLCNDYAILLPLVNDIYMSNITLEEENNVYTMISYRYFEVTINGNIEKNQTQEEDMA